MMKHTTPIIALCLLLAFALSAFAQQPTPSDAPQQAEIGMPLLRNYTPKEYNGDAPGLEHSAGSSRRALLRYPQAPCWNTTASPGARSASPAQVAPSPWTPQGKSGWDS